MGQVQVKEEQNQKIIQAKIIRGFTKKRIQSFRETLEGTIKQWSKIAKKMVVVDESSGQKKVNRFNNRLLIQMGKYEWPVLKQIVLKSHYLDHEGVVELAKISLQNIQVLDLSENYFKPSVLEILGTCNLKNLRHLNLSYNLIGDQGLKLLSDYQLPNLNILKLDQSKITNKGIKQLTKNTYNHLHTISLSKNNLLSKQKRFYVAQLQTPKLHILDLSHCNLNESCVKNMNKNLWPDLSFLNLEENILEFSNLFNNEKNPGWSKLIVMKLGYGNCSIRGLKCLVEFPLAQLRYISLYESNLSISHTSLFARANWPKLEVINLGGNKIGQEGAKNISKAHWPCLKRAGFSFNKLNDHGIGLLMRSNWLNVQNIHLDSNRASCLGVMQISSAGLKYLRNLHLDRNVLNKHKQMQSFLSQQLILEVSETNILTYDF